MGQLPDKCNCFNSKYGNKDLMIEDKVISIQGNQQHKQPNVKAIPNLNRTKTKVGKDKLKLKSAIIYSDDYDREIIDMIAKFQGVIRGAILRSKLTIIKEKLEKETLNKIQTLALKFKTPILEKVESNQKFAYNPNGWSKFYAKDCKNFKVNYGKTYLTKLRVSDNNSAIFSGHTNLNGQRHGYGVCVNSNAIKYEGFWQNGEFTGWGKKVDQEGNVMMGKHKKFYKI